MHWHARGLSYRIDAAISKKIFASIILQATLSCKVWLYRQNKLKSSFYCFRLDIF